MAIESLTMSPQAAGSSASAAAFLLSQRSYRASCLEGGSRIASYLIRSIVI